MASGDIEPCMVDLTPRGQHDEHETVQVDLTDYENDASLNERVKILRAMYIGSVITVIISMSTMMIGVLTHALIPNGAFIFCVGMTLPFTICLCCLYYTGRKKTRGNKMGATYMCCLTCMIISFAFALCGVLITLGISGIWATNECVNAKQRFILYENMCLENTSLSLIISVLTLILTCALLIVILIITGIFCYNKKVLGVKTEAEQIVEEQLGEIRRAAREEALRAVAHLNAGRDTQNSQTFPNTGLEKGIPDTRHAMEPSAPMLEEPPPSYDAVMGDKRGKSPV